MSYLLFGNDDFCWQLRDIIIRFENLNSTLFETRMTGINGATFAEHISKMTYPYSWATHIEVFGVATYFQVPVFFCTDPPKQGDYCWEYIKPLTSPENLKYPVLVEQFSPTIPSHFELVYYQRHHYDCVVSLQTGTIHLSPPQLTNKIIHIEV